MKYDKFHDTTVIDLNEKILKFWGVILPNNKIKKSLYLFMHFSTTLFVVTEVIDLFATKYEFDILLTNIKFTLLAIVSCAKNVTFIYRQKDWLSIIDYVARADKNSRRDADDIDKKTIDSYNKYSRIGSYIYIVLSVMTVSAVMGWPLYFFITSGGKRLIPVVSAWAPIDKSTTYGYLITSVYQCSASIFGGGWTVSFDSTSMVIMVFIRGELMLLKKRCSQIFEGGNDQALLRIKECHLRHLELVKYSKLFDSCLSPIMFLYMIVCSVMLCASVYQITVGTSALQRFFMAEYLVFGIAQLFVFCWHGNDVLFASKETIRGIYDSTWYKSCAYRRELMILSWQLDKRIIFSAGPFLQLTVATFVSIIKGAYSYYTIMTQATKQEHF